MSNLPSEKLFIQTESVVTRAPVSESLTQTIGGSVNFILEKGYQEHSFTMNGPYKNASGKNGIDGLLVFQWDAEIFNVVISNRVAGDSGTTQLDLKKAIVSGGAFTSIFTTKPSISFTAGNSVWIGVGGVVSGCVAPILTVNPFHVNAGDAIRCDVISTMTGSPRECEIIVYYRQR